MSSDDLERRIASMPEAWVNIALRVFGYAVSFPLRFTSIATRFNFIGLLNCVLGVPLQSAPSVERWNSRLNYDNWNHKEILNLGMERFKDILQGKEIGDKIEIELMYRNLSFRTQWTLCEDNDAVIRLSERLSLKIDNLSDDKWYKKIARKASWLNHRHRSTNIVIDWEVHQCNTLIVDNAVKWKPKFWLTLEWQAREDVNEDRQVYYVDKNKQELMDCLSEYPQFSPETLDLIMDISKSWEVIWKIISLSKSEPNLQNWRFSLILDKNSEFVSSNISSWEAHFMSQLKKGLLDSFWVELIGHSWWFNLGDITTQHVSYLWNCWYLIKWTFRVDERILNDLTRLESFFVEKIRTSH